MGYDYKDLKAAYRKLGVRNGRCVYLAADLACLGPAVYSDRDEILEAHYRVLRDLVGEDGTIVVPTASLNLCNTDIPFDVDKTPSNMGVLTEYIRNKKGAVRSFHPFISETAVGRHAKAICTDNTRLPYGPESPHARMMDLDSLCISIGLHPRVTCSTIHHVELVMGVPYRYIKEFIHPVLRHGRVRHEPFYMHVWYRECNLKRNGNLKIFEDYIKRYELKSERLGKGKIYSYNMVNLYRSAVESFKKNVYLWLDKAPDSKPYRR